MRTIYLSILGSQPCLHRSSLLFFLKAQPLLFSCSGSEINHPNLCVKLRRSTLAQNLAAAHRRQRNSWAKQQLGQLRTPRIRRRHHCGMDGDAAAAYAVTTHSVSQKPTTHWKTGGWSIQRRRRQRRQQHCVAAAPTSGALLCSGGGLN